MPWSWRSQRLRSIPVLRDGAGASHRSTSNNLRRAPTAGRRCVVPTQCGDRGADPSDPRDFSHGAVKNPPHTAYERGPVFHAVVARHRGKNDSELRNPRTELSPITKAVKGRERGAGHKTSPPSPLSGYPALGAKRGACSSRRPGSGRDVAHNSPCQIVMGEKLG